MGKLFGVTLDVGGSELRAKPLSTGEIMAIPNDAVAIEKENFRYKPTDEPFNLCEIVEAPKSEYLGIVASGTAGAMYDNEVMTLKSGEAKTNQNNYYKQVIYTIARACMIDKIKKRNQNAGMGTHYVDETYDCINVICIPVREFSGKEDCASKLKANLVGTYVAEFPLMDTGMEKVAFTLQASRMGVVAEGGVAVLALSKTLSPDSISVVVDMGDYSTDIAVFKGKSMLGNRVVSLPWAGRTLLTNLRLELCDMGYMLSQADMPRILETGEVKEGVDSLSVKSIVQEKKKQFVDNYLKNEILQLLNANMIAPSQVENLIPIGAPMNSVEDEESISDFIADACDMRSAMIVKVADNLRYANIEQASIFTQMLFNKESKQGR